MTEIDLHFLMRALRVLCKRTRIIVVAGIRPGSRRGFQNSVRTGPRNRTRAACFPHRRPCPEGRLGHRDLRHCAG